MGWPLLRKLADAYAYPVSSRRIQYLPRISSRAVADPTLAAREFYTTMHAAKTYEGDLRLTQLPASWSGPKWNPRQNRLAPVARARPGLQLRHGKTRVLCSF
jgi:hypothetical protein